jgi:hypothetical protein
MRLFFLFLLVSLASSCSGAAPADNEPPTNEEPGFGEIVFPSILPFVEDIELPEKIVAQSPFTVTVKVSAQLHPLSLRRDNRGATEASWRYEGAELSGVNLFLYLTPNAENAEEDPGPVVDHYEFKIPGMPAGNYQLVVDGAKTRELGGMDADFQVVPFPQALPNSDIQPNVLQFTVSAASS